MRLSGVYYLKEGTEKSTLEVFFEVAYIRYLRDRQL